MEKTDIYQRVTDLIVSAIEAGAPSYRMPWRTSGAFVSSPINAVSKRPYRGINVLVLWASAQAKGYTSGTWATFKQWEQLGARVRKGEKSTNVVFWKFLDLEETEDKSDHDTRRIPMAREYSVFNAGQVEGYREPVEIPLSTEERNEEAESFFHRVGVRVKDGGNDAFYSLEEDAVFMPGFETFRSPLAYYSVFAHETCHWTGAPQRLNRKLSERFGSEAYAMEELVAELGAGFLCSHLSLPDDPRTDHAPYIASWLKALRNDKRAIFTAAAKAQEAVDWLNKISENVAQSVAV